MLLSLSACRARYIIPESVMQTNSQGSSSSALYTAAQVRELDRIAIE